MKYIKQVIRYTNCNATGLKDYRETIAQPDGNLRRTGAIEGNIDKLIVRQMKKLGMGWSLRGI